MKIVIIGGGAHRVLGILRSAMASPGVLDGGEINLFDLNTARSEAMGRMLLKTPEQARANCRITWGTSLEQALDGAGAVAVILRAGSPRTFSLGEAVSLSHGFITSDNISPNGAFLAIKGASILMDVARKMQRHCPEAWLLNFANPTAVLSGMVNNHTRIRCLGLCQGFTNHLWDISRVMGVDEEASALDVDAAGVNHMSFILRGTWQGRDLFRVLEERISADWKMCELQPWWGEFGQRNITNSVTNLVRFWRQLGVLIFSTEGDGMAHLKYDEAVEDARRGFSEPTAQQLDAKLQEQAAARAEADRTFKAYLDQDLDERFWAEHWKKDSRFQRADEDVFVRTFCAIAGMKETKIASSMPNRGAIAGIKDRHVVEFSHYLYKDKVRPAAQLSVPDVVHGLVASLAAHQTMIGDAMAMLDPKLLAQALMAYPIRPYSRDAREMYKQLFAINCDEIPPQLRTTHEYL